MLKLHALPIACILLHAFLQPLLADDAKEDTPLEQEMSAMNKPYRSLSKAFRKAPDASNNAEYLAMAESILKHAKGSVDFVPVRASKLDEAAQKKMVAEYQKAMQESITTLEQLVKALKADDYTKATELLAKLKKQKSDGHDRFKEEDED